MNKLIKGLVITSIAFTGNVFAQCSDANFAAWSDAREDVAGTLEAVAPGFNASACAMSVASTASDGDRARVQDQTPACESSYRVRFEYNIDSLGALTNAERVKVFNFQCIDGASCPNTGIFQAKLKGDGDSGNNIFRSFITDENQANADNRRKFDIPAEAGQQELELHWVRASGAGVSDGIFKAWWGGNTDENNPNLIYTDVNNFNYCVDQANLGLVKANQTFATAKSGTAFLFDEFESRRQSGIGVSPPAP